MEACLSIKFAYLDWLTCKKCLLGGHGKARRTVKTLSVGPVRVRYSTIGRRHICFFGSLKAELQIVVTH